MTGKGRRSLTRRELDVAKVAEAYGGGGHANAAGFSVTLKQWLEEFA